jgi:hypothetical protein
MFRPLRYRDIKLLEIGVQFGNSLRTWHEYFPFAKIWGVDSVDNNIKLPDDIVVLYTGAYNDDTVQRLGSKTYDIIIDDGSHTPLDQIWFVINYAPLLAPEGVLIVEDVLDRTAIPALASAIPNGFDYTAVEMPEGNSQVDSRLFMCWRKSARSTTWTVYMKKTKQFLVQRCMPDLVKPSGVANIKVLIARTFVPVVALACGYSVFPDMEPWRTHPPDD